MKPISCDKEMGDTERLFAQEPHRVLLIIISTIKQESIDHPGFVLDSRSVSL